MDAIGDKSAAFVAGLQGLTPQEQVTRLRESGFEAKTVKEIGTKIGLSPDQLRQALLKSRFSCVTPDGNFENRGARSTPPNAWDIHKRLAALMEHPDVQALREKLRSLRGPISVHDLQQLTSKLSTTIGKSQAAKLVGKILQESVVNDNSSRSEVTAADLTSTSPLTKILEEWMLNPRGDLIIDEAHTLVSPGTAKVTFPNIPLDDIQVMLGRYAPIQEPWDAITIRDYTRAELSQIMDHLLARHGITAPEQLAAARTAIMGKLETPEPQNAEKVRELVDKWIAEQKK